MDSTIENKISQMFMVSFKGSEINKENYNHFKENGFSNFMFFSHNLKSYECVYRLCNDLKGIAEENSQIPPFISIDQEGGMVSRLFSGATHFPSAMSVGRSGIPNVGYHMGKMVGKELRNLGINFNLAPVLDINNNPDNPVIGVRSFSEDMHTVAEIGTDYIRGLQEVGVIATAKHFPGHGDTNIDSHLGLPIIRHSLSRLQEVELFPFIKAIEEGVMAIMSAHIIFPSLDNTNIPGTLSSKILTGFLREELGYNGLIISDALDMDAISSRYSIGDACIKAINAGVDLLCLSGGGDYALQSEGYRCTVDAVKNGAIKEDVIHNAFDRIVKAKKQIGLSFNEICTPCAYYPQHEEYAERICSKSIQVIRDDLDLIPLSTSSKVLVLSPPPIRSNIADDNIVRIRSFAYMAYERTGWDYVEIDINPSESQIDSILSKVDNYETVVCATYNIGLYKNQLKLANALSSYNIVFVTLRVPYDVTKIDNPKTYIHAYEYTNRSVTKVVDILLGL